MSDLARALKEAGGVAAPATALAQLRGLLGEELGHGAGELDKPRSGYERPVTVGVAAGEGGLLGVGPVPAALRADPNAVGERGWLLTAALVGALCDLALPGPPAGSDALVLTAGDHDGFLVVAVPGDAEDAAGLDELVPLAFDDHAHRVARLRARALALPPGLLVPGELKPPIGAAHPLRVAEAVARLGGRPAVPGAVDELEDALAPVIGDGGAGTRPHEDPDPARRAARRILQRLNGMGKWGGYHTEFAHLPRGFAGNERALAQEVGEALLTAGLLQEKPSVGQRHVFLNPRRARDIHRFIESGEVPGGLRLPQT